MAPKNLCNNRNIPLPIQRKVRQRCGFGCVICGIPIYDYEHMLGWANVKRHRAEEITLLCSQHHREKTVGLLTKEDVSEANNNPYNLRKRRSKPYNLHFKGKDPKIRIDPIILKGVRNANYLCPLIINDMPIISFYILDKHLFLDLNLFDKDNNKILEINKNQLVYSINNWDIEFKAKELKIREKLGKIKVEIEFFPPNEIFIKKAYIFYKNHMVLIENNGIRVNKIVFKGFTIKGYVGLAIGKYTGVLKPAFVVPSINPQYITDKSI